MLSPAERGTLAEQLKFIFEQFVETDQQAIVHAVLRMSMESIQAVLELADSYLDDVDDAACGPTPARVDYDAGSEVRCPHCHRTF